MNKEFTPNDAGDVTGWFMLFGDYSMAVRSTTPASPAGACVVKLERKRVGDGDDKIEQVGSITAASGTADALSGSERMRHMQHRLRCSSYTTAGAVITLRSSGLIEPQ